MATKTLSRGDKGRLVRKLQRKLSAQGFHLKVDGDFGTVTYDSVLQFQAGRDLTLDGVVGPATWAALDAPTKTRAEEVAEDPSLNDQQQWALAQIPDAVLAGDPRRDVLAAAIKDLGADEVPDGSNGGVEIQHLVDGYNTFHGIGGSKRYAWCAMAVSSWIGIGLDIGEESLTMDWALHPFGTFQGGSLNIERWGKERGVFVSSESAAPAGAAFTMFRGGSGSDPARSSGAGHVGLVICDNNDGTFTTIEGNVSNGVRCKIRKKSDVNGFTKWWEA